MNIQERYGISIIKGIEVFEVDYTSLKEEDYISLSEKLFDYAIERDPEHTYFLINANKILTSPKAIEAAKKNVIRTAHLNFTVALFNTSDVYRMIIKLVFAFSKRRVTCVKTREEALDFLQNEYYQNIINKLDV